MERKTLLLFLVADVKTKNQELRTKLRTPENNVDNTRTKADNSPKPYKKPVLYHSCLELMNNGHNESGKYEIAPFPNSTKTVYCDQDTYGGGWTVFLRNKHSLVTFDKNWNEYKSGFGNIEYDFWLGNEYLYNITTLHNSHSSKTVELYVSIVDLNDKIYYAKYNNFAILSEASKYTLHVPHHSKGTMGDSLERHNNMKFTTKVSHNDNGEVFFWNCASRNNGCQWWFDDCSNYGSILTHMYYDKNSKRDIAALKWFSLHKNRDNLKSATMMFREKL